MSVTCSRPVDAAEIDERAVVGDVLDHAVDDLALFEVLHQLLALLGAGLFQHRAARDDDVAAAPVHLEDLERLRLVHQRPDIADRPDVDLAARQERHRAVEIDGEAALDLVEDDARHLLVVLEGQFELAPAFLAARFVARQHGLAERVFDPLEIDLDLVADLDLVRPAGRGEFAERDAPLGLQAHIDDRQILFDADHDPIDDGSFLHLVGAERLLQQGRKILTRRRGRVPNSSCHEFSYGWTGGSSDEPSVTVRTRGSAGPQWPPMLSAGRPDQPNGRDVCVLPAAKIYDESCVSQPGERPRGSPGTKGIRPAGTRPLYRARAASMIATAARNAASISNCVVSSK